MNNYLQGKIIAVCISETTGSAKYRTGECRFIAERGIEGDGHIDTIRPVSLLMSEDIEAYNSSHQKKAEPGNFAENIVTAGIDLRKAAVGDRIRIGESVLEVCQIGKEVLPHHYSFNGDRLLPSKGVFCRVMKSGTARVGTAIELIKS